MAARKITPKQVIQACEWREAGLSYGQIRQRFMAQGVDISEGSISWHCLINGADLPADQRKPVKSFERPVYQRGAVTIRPFTPEEDALLRVLDLQGFRTCQIAKRLGRRWNSVRGRLACLARQDARAEEDLELA